MHLRPRTEPFDPPPRSAELDEPDMQDRIPYTPSSLLNPKRVVVYGSSLCVCCTKLRRALEIEGWRYRWAEIRGKHATVQLKKMFPEWKGGLPVIVIEGHWLEVKSTLDGELCFAPWPINNPKKRRFIPLEL
mgnify:CR=1 FL=1